MTEFFVSPRTGEVIQVEPWRIGWKLGKNTSKNMIRKKRQKKPVPKGVRGKDRKPRQIHPNSLKNLKRGKDKKPRQMHPNSLKNLPENLWIKEKEKGKND